MGKLIKICRMRWSVYAIHFALAIVTLFVFFIFQYTKEFFSMYQSVAQILDVLQWICLALVVGLIVIVFMQYKKAGAFAFYENGVMNQITKQFYYYHDIMTYSFIPQSNKRALNLYFETDDLQEDSLNALLDPQAFTLFQEGHAKIWAPFVIKQIEAKRLISFDVDEDVTSFKMQVDATTVAEKELILSHEGIVCYAHFYPWSKISRYEISFSGMLSIKDDEFKTIFMEPMVNIERYFIFVKVLEHYIDKH